MCNNTECKIVGIGIVLIKTHNGVVRTLSNVCHIPHMTCNLISLAILEANRCRYSAENSVLKLMKGAMILMKGFR